MTSRPTISLHLCSFQLCFSNWRIKQSDSAWMRMFELFVITISCAGSSLVYICTGLYYHLCWKCRPLGNYNNETNLVTHSMHQSLQQEQEKLVCCVFVGITPLLANFKYCSKIKTFNSIFQSSN